MCDEDTLKKHIKTNHHRETDLGNGAGREEDDCLRTGLKGKWKGQTNGTIQNLISKARIAEMRNNIERDFDTATSGIKFHLMHRVG